MGDDQAPNWVVPAMRVGFATRGVTYVLIGVLAALAGWTGGQAEGTTGALASLRSAPLASPRCG